MNGFDYAMMAVAVALAFSAALVVAVVVYKAVHRRSLRRHRFRRSIYLKLLSRHVMDPGSTPELSLRQAEDDAFLEAVIEIRNTLLGPSVESLDGIIDRTGLASHQAARLRARLRKGRRLRAAASLAEIGDPRTARVLMHHLSDRVPEIRVQSARGLARMKHTPAVDLILNRYHAETAWVQSRFAEILPGFGREAIWPLVAYIRIHQHSEGRGVPEVVRALGVIGDMEVGPALSEVLYTSQNVEVRLALIETLGSIGGPLALRPLRRAFRSDDWRVRAKAASALGSIGDPSVNPLLATGLTDTSWWTRRNSAAALAMLPGGVDFLFDGLTSEDRYARDASAEALADIGELVAARDRMERGVPQPRDIRLIDYMQTPQMVFT